MGTYKKCPKKYHYQYIEKPDVPKQDWSHLEFGKCAHRVLELFHEDLIKNVRDRNEYAKIMRDSFKLGLSEFDKNILRDDLPELKQTLQIYLNNIFKNGLPQVIYNEKSFDFKVGENHVRGFIDRIDKVSDIEYRIVDYKTNKNPKYLTNFQLLLYALALKEMIPEAKIISGSYILLKHQCKTLDYTFTEDDYKKTLDEIKNIGHSIDTNVIWKKEPSILCNWCEFQNICQGSWV
jgi:CRISPR/Cas system-associated exonuclease Cas4 (RecB family)